MDDALLAGLRARRSQTCARWKALLHAAPVANALGEPRVLVHLMDSTINEIFARLAEGMTRGGRPPFHVAEVCRNCRCGRNPLLTYFSAGEQAMREALILAQAASRQLNPAERDDSMKELNQVLCEISQSEIESFCGLCQQPSDGNAAPGGP